MTGPQIRALSALEVSREIQKIRRKWEETENTTELDFYILPLKEVWKSKVPKKPKTTEKSAFDQQTEGVKHSLIFQALREIDENDYPPDARSSTYDLIYGSRRYPPKYVCPDVSRSAKAVMAGRMFASPVF